MDTGSFGGSGIMNLDMSMFMINGKIFLGVLSLRQKNRSIIGFHRGK